MGQKASAGDLGMTTVAIQEEVSIEQKLLDPQVRKMLLCPRCLQSHAVTFHVFKHPIKALPKFRYWGLCPVTGEPIISEESHIQYLQRTQTNERIA